MHETLDSTPQMSARLLHPGGREPDAGLQPGPGRVRQLRVPEYLAARSDQAIACGKLAAEPRNCMARIDGVEP
jgi:hypothetical protein